VRSPITHERERALAVGGHVYEPRQERRCDELGDRGAVDNQCELAADPRDAAADAKQGAEESGSCVGDTGEVEHDAGPASADSCVTCDSSVRASVIAIVPPTATTWVFASAAIESSVKPRWWPGISGLDSSVATGASLPAVDAERTTAVLVLDPSGVPMDGCRALREGVP
jgi:hypothetical protein